MFFTDACPLCHTQPLFLFFLNSLCSKHILLLSYTLTPTRLPYCSHLLSHGVSGHVIHFETVTQQSEHYFHLIKLWHQRLVFVAKHKLAGIFFLEGGSLGVGGAGRCVGGAKLNLWCPLGLRLRIPGLFLCLTTAVFPVRQEVSSVSCHSPLSCGHFLVFCQCCCCVLLTQRMEVVLLVVGSDRTEKTFYYLWRHDPAFRDNVS